MSFEVEVKYRTAAHADLARRLVELGARAEEAIEQEDIYLRHPARDFAQTGEALRLRREGESNLITYKGPRQGGATKTREEVELAFDPGAEARQQMRRLWEALGFEPVAVLHKRRRLFRLDWAQRAVVVGLDDAGEEGTFAEVEAIAGDAGDLPGAQAAVLALAAALRLTEVEPRSYLRMALDRKLAGQT